MFSNSILYTENDAENNYRAHRYNDVISIQCINFITTDSIEDGEFSTVFTNMFLAILC